MNVEIFKLKDKYFKAFIYLLIFSLVYIFPILLANFYYIDDLGRSLRGYTGWEGNGRPLASLLAVILSDGKPLMDISPWIQIASVIILDYSLVLFVKRYIPKATAFGILCVASCSYLNLFLLENLSYKYDSFGMMVALSIFLILYSLPVCFSTLKTILLSVFAVFISFSIYQAAIGAYISLAILEYMYLLYIRKNWRNRIHCLFSRLFAVLTGGILYKLLVADIFVAKDGYSNMHSSFINVLTVEGLQRVYVNLTVFWNMFKVYASTLGILGILLVFVLCIGLGHIAYSLWKHRDEFIRTKIVSVVTVLFLPFLLILASVIALAFLNSPVFVPRVMLSFTIFTLFIGFVIYYLSEVRKVFLAIAAFILISILSFSSSYGNLLNRQERMDSLIATYIVYDMNTIEAQQGKKIDKVAFIGHSPKSQELLLAEKKRPLFNMLVPIRMNNDWYWGGQYLSHYRKNEIQMNRDRSNREYIVSATPCRSNEFYRLYLYDDTVIVKFLE